MTSRHCVHHLEIIEIYHTALLESCDSGDFFQFTMTEMNIAVNEILTESVICDQNESNKNIN